MAVVPTKQFDKIGSELAPNFDIAISDKKISKGSPLWTSIRPYIQSVVYEDDESLASFFELTLINQPNATPGKRVDWTAIIDHLAFQEGNSIDLWIGYNNQRTYMGRTEIVRWLPTFPSGGDLQTFTIKGMDGRHRMMQDNHYERSGKRKRTTSYKKTTDDQIVKRIAAKYGYGVDADRPTGQKSVTRVHRAELTDWEFLERLAQLNMFDLWVAYSDRARRFDVHFKKRDESSAPIYKFTYRDTGDGSLIEAEPDFAIDEQPTEVEILYYDASGKIARKAIGSNTKSERVELGNAAPREAKAKKPIIGAGARIRFTAFGQVIECHSSRPIRSEKQAEKEAQRYLRERERDFLILQGKVIGLPDVRPRQVHLFEGMSKRIDGAYRLTNVRHPVIVDGNYETEFIGYKVVDENDLKRIKSAKVETVGLDQTKYG